MVIVEKKGLVFRRKVIDLSKEFKEGKKIYEGLADYISVLSKTGSAKVYVDEIIPENEISVDEVRSIKLPKGYHKIYVVNENEQSGKGLVLGIGTEADIQVEPRQIGETKLLDENNNVVNPAKEDTLTQVRANTENLVKVASTPYIYNVECTNANTEYNQALPDNTKKFLIKARGGQLKVCFTEGQSGSVYILLSDGQAWYEDNVLLTGKTLYFQSPNAGVVAEIIAWV